MGARPRTGAAAWHAARHRASVLAEEGEPGGRDEDNWDFVAIRDIIAVVLFALHLRDRQPVEDVPWGSALWYLVDDERVIALVEEVLPGAGYDLHPPGRPGEEADPVVVCWRWLNRTWNPHAPVRPRTWPPALWNTLVRSNGSDGGDEPEPRWGGMSRGIGSGLPDPAIEVCVGWAAAGVAAAVSAERGGLRKFQRVLVLGGAYEGQFGYVRDLVWVFDDRVQQVADGPPVGYVVDLDDRDGAVEIDAEHLTDRADGRRWAYRRPGSRKDVAYHVLEPSFEPEPSCADDLARILGRAANPEIVSDELRRTIASAHRHHHLELDRQASPRPHRFSWRILQHWYQLGEVYAHEEVVSLWEIELTKHLQDREPSYHLVLTEEEVPVMLARRTGLPLDRAARGSGAA